MTLQFEKDKLQIDELLNLFNNTAKDLQRPKENMTFMDNNSY